MAKPFVTVLIDTYNHERFIEQAVTSVLAQDFPPAEREILVVDDGSTDHTAAILQTFAPQVRYLGKANGGQASAFNAAIPEARGEVVAFLDGDDWWAPTKLSRVVEVLCNHPAVGMVGHGITEVYPDGRQHVEVIKEIPRFRADSLEGALAFRLRKSQLGTSRMTIRAALLQRILPVPELLRIEADEYLFTLASVLADVLILQEPLTFYRMHSSNLYQISGFVEERVRQKQRILAALVGSLSEGLRSRGVSPQVAGTITEEIEAEADQLRLALDGGAPWETVRTELKIDRIVNKRAPRSHRALKYASMIVALLLPPRVFYRLKRRLGGSDFYLRARKALAPLPEAGHVVRYWKAGS